MKIGPLENKPAVAGTAGERKAKVAESVVSTAAGDAPEPSAKVELSAAGSAIASALADGSFDAQKVERVSRAIREGTYRIDAEAIADKLIGNSRELLEAGRN